MNDCGHPRFALSFIEDPDRPHQPIAVLRCLDCDQVTYGFDPAPMGVMP